MSPQGQNSISSQAFVAPRLNGFRRITIKIGSALLVDPSTGLRGAWLESLADDIAELVAQGIDVLVVSSGAIALGRGLLHLHPGGLKLEESQAAAAVGQIALARAYSECLGKHNLTAAQVLLTLQDTEQRRRYLNARATIDQLFKLHAVPVINENDTVATNEIRYGDNDRLAARVATMVSSDLLVLLSDVDGLYTAPPGQDPNAEHIDHVPLITSEIEAMAGEAASIHSRGGMRTKIDAAKIAVSGGSTMVIANGHAHNPIRAISEGARVTWFTTGETPVTARKRWIAGQIDVTGKVVIDQGATAALKRGKSLLPAGVVSVEGSFRRGDAVVIEDQDHSPLGRGLINFDREDAQRIMGHKSEEVAGILGYAGRTALIHRDDMVLLEASSTALPDRSEQPFRQSEPMKASADTLQ